MVSCQYMKHVDLCILFLRFWVTRVILSNVNSMINKTCRKFLFLSLKSSMSFKSLLYFSAMKLKGLGDSNESFRWLCYFLSECYVKCFVFLFSKFYIMGQTLSEPVTSKESACCQNSLFRVGSSCMQGWRINMEDSHTHILSLPDDPETAFFAVYDGHGGI